MTRLAMIAGTYRPSHCGVADYTARLCRELRDVGVQIEILTSHQAPPAPGVARVVPAWTPACLPLLTREILNHQPDIVHIQHAPGTYRFQRSISLLPLALRLAGWDGPLVVTLHEYGAWTWEPWFLPARLRQAAASLGERHGWWDREDGFLTTLSDVLITTNPEAERLVCRRLPGRAARLHRIPIAMNIEPVRCDRTQARAALCAQLGWPTEATVLAFFGFVHPVKGLETLFRAVALARQRHPALRLVVIGGTESLALQGEDAAGYLRTLHALRHELGLDDVIHFTGHIPAARASLLLSGADLGVLPFNHGINLKSGSLLTHLAHGLPTIATHFDPPVPELERGEVVELIPPRDPRALARAIETLLEQPERRRALAANGRAFARPFSWESIVQSHLALYGEVTGSSVSQARRVA